MARINLTTIGVAAAVGVVDELLERQDNAKGRKDFARWSYISRLLSVVGGHAVGQFFTQWSSLGETVATASTPLLVKSLATQFMPVTRVGAVRRSVNFIPRHVSAPASPESENWAPGGSRGNYRPLQ